MSSSETLHRARSLAHYRGRDLLHREVHRYDLPANAFYCAVITGALLLFSGGAMLGAVLAVLHDYEATVLTFTVLSSLLLIAVVAFACLYWEHVTERRASLLETLGSYMDAEYDCAKYANTEEGRLDSFIAKAF